MQKSYREANYCKWFIVFMFALIASCSGVTPVGDAELIDNGIFAASRYKIDFGEIDTEGEFKRAYNLHHLPHEEFILGLEGEISQIVIDNIDHISVTVYADGNEALNIDQPITNWVHNITSGKSESFLFCCKNRLNLSSKFITMGNTDYEVQLIIKGDMRNRSNTIRFVATGGGWK